MTFISAIPPSVGSSLSAHRVTRLTGRHPFDIQSPFVGTMKIDSFVFHAFGGPANACFARHCLIPREALRHKALRATGKVFRKASSEVETLRWLHEPESPCAMPRASRPLYMALRGEEWLTVRLH